MQKKKKKKSAWEFDVRPLHDKLIYLWTHCLHLNDAIMQCLHQNKMALHFVKMQRKNEKDPHEIQLEGEEDKKQQKKNRKK